MFSISRKSDAIGVYALDNPSAKFTLELRSDGTYIHSAISEAGEKIPKIGKWDWGDNEVDNRVSLYDLEIFPKEDIGPPGVVSGIYCLSLERYWGGIRIPIGDPGDLDSSLHYFIKQ